MDAGGSRRSLVGTSRLVQLCHGWRRSSRRMRSLDSSCAPLGEGLHPTRWPSTTAQHRPAPPVRRVALRADHRAVRWGWPCAAAHSRARCRLRAGRVARVEHAEGARVRPWAAPHRPTTPGSRVAFRFDRRWRDRPNPSPSPGAAHLSRALAATFSGTSDEFGATRARASGVCGGQPGAGGFHGDGRGATRISTPEPRVGRRDDAIRVRPSMATMATMATPRSRLKRILELGWVGVNQRTPSSDGFFFKVFSRGGQGGHGGHGQPASGSRTNGRARLPAGCRERCAP